MTTKLFTKPLDDSNGSIKVNHNNAMQLASQTKKTPWFLRWPPAILRKSGLAVLALTMLLVVVQPPSVNAEIRAITLGYYRDGVGETAHWRTHIRVVGMGIPYEGGYGSNDPTWTAYRINAHTERPALLRKITAINETLGDDLGRALKKYIGDIDSMTASTTSAAASCMIRNSSVKFPGCIASWLNSWEVHLLFAIEELESSVNSALRSANSSASALVSSYSN